MAQLEQHAWIRNPFQVDLTKASLSAAYEAQLIDLSCDGTLKGKLSESSLSIFWLNGATVFPEPTGSISRLCVL